MAFVFHKCYEDNPKNATFAHRHLKFQIWYLSDGFNFSVESGGIV